MNVVFYLSAVIAVAATLMVITRTNAVHALLYLIVSLLAVAVVFFVLGAPFAAALEIIIYAGAIMVLFVFVVMMLNLGEPAVEQERRWLEPGIWVGPTVLSAVLLGEVVYILASGGAVPSSGAEVGAGAVGATLFGPYLLAVEIASMLLLAGLVGAYHLGRPPEESEEAQADAPARTTTQASAPAGSVGAARRREDRR
jgi:NADH-quinone oxidoreductase subunit J